MTYCSSDVYTIPGIMGRYKKKKKKKTTQTSSCTVFLFTEEVFSFKFVPFRSQVWLSSIQVFAQPYLSRSPSSKKSPSVSGKLRASALRSSKLDVFDVFIWKPNRLGVPSYRESHVSCFLKLTLLQREEGKYLNGKAEFTCQKPSRIVGLDNF